MELNSKSTLAKFYMWLPPDDKKLPQDLCTYFWGLVGRAFFLFGICGMALFSLIYAIVTAVLWLSRLMWAHKAPTMIVLGAIAVVVLGKWLAERKKKITIGILSEAKIIIEGRIDAAKNRYCPRIDWK